MVALICISQMSPLEKCLFMPFAHVFTGLFVLGVLSLITSLEILDTNPSSDNVVCKYLVPFHWLPFSFADCFLHCAEAFYFDKVPIVYFAFVSLASRDVLSKKLLWPRSKRFLPAFSSRILMASCPTFRSFIHCEFSFVYDVKNVV